MDDANWAGALVAFGQVLGAQLQFLSHAAEFQGFEKWSGVLKSLSQEHGRLAHHLLADME